MTFIPVKPAQAKAVKKLELKAGFTFPAESLPWSFRPGQTRKIGAAVVDTDGNLAPDTLVAGTSNFAAGRSPERIQAAEGGWGCPSCAVYTCHSTGTEEEHCYWEANPPGCDWAPICPE